jgi:predicted nucleic acid-binding protein
MKSSSNKRVLVDSDAFIGWLNNEDLLHEDAVKVLKNIERAKLTTLTTSLVVAETATTLSNRLGQAQARAFLEFVENLPVVHISEEIQNEALQLFREQATKGTSVVDCANVVVMKRLQIPVIFSFDGFYKKQGLKMAA